MPLNCNRVSGQDGGFMTANGVVHHLTQWTMGENATVNSEARSNTQGYQVSWTGAKNANGGFNIAGAEPVIKIKDSGIFTGYTGGGVGKGKLYKLRADVNNVVLNLDWENLTSSTQYQFVSNFQNSGDELTVTDVTQSSQIITDLSPPRAFRPPLWMPGDPAASPPVPEFYPVLINDTPLCMQNATITFSAQPNTLSDSCTGGWQTVLGIVCRRSW